MKQSVRNKMEVKMRLAWGAEIDPKTKLEPPFGYHRLLDEENCPCPQGVPPEGGSKRLPS